MGKHPICYIFCYDLGLFPIPTLLYSILIEDLGLLSHNMGHLTWDYPPLSITQTIFAATIIYIDELPICFIEPDDN